MSNTQAATTQVAQAQQSQQPAGLIVKFAQRFGVEPNKMVATLKATAFRQRQNEPEVSNEQLMALLVVADQYGLNPWTKEIFAFPDKQNGIVPVVGVDGWSRIVNTQQQCDGIEFRQSEEIVTPQGGKPSPAWMECVIYRKDRDHPTVVREYLDEVYRPPFKGTGSGGKEYTKDGPWQSHTKRMLRHKSLIQCARLAFGFVGIYDEDEAHRIIDGVATRMESGGGTAPAVAAINASVAGTQGTTIEGTATQAESDTDEQTTGADQGGGDTQTTATPAEKPTHASVSALIAAATDTDKLNEAVDLIRNVENKDHQKELRDAAKARAKELAGAK